jgi:hypothetical protein
MTDLATTRRDLIALRVKHKGNPALTTRISLLISQLETLEAGTADEHHARRLHDLIAQSMQEISEIQANGGQTIKGPRNRTPQ